jgi:hypothetical protein
VGAVRMPPFPTDEILKRVDDLRYGLLEIEDL